MPSIAIIANVYNEAHALPGMLENAKQFADDIFIYHTGPGGKPSTDGTMEILEQSGVRWKMGDISKGFGVIRTHLIRHAKADWCLITDADERWWLEEPLLTCHGTEAYPQHKNPALTTKIRGAVRPKEMLLRMMQDADKQGIETIRLSRRHWMKEPGDWTHPCQNWHTIPDWQLRVLKTSPYLFYDPNERMHEKLLDSRTWSEPRYLTGDQTNGPFHCHHHIWFKAKDGAQNKEDAEIYNQLESGIVEKMWLEETMKR
jgi:glycosyltransferase involved in cell wall biosynthesis